MPSILAGAAASGVGVGVGSADLGSSVFELSVAMSMSAGCKLATKALKLGKSSELIHDMSANDDQATYAAVNPIAATICFQKAQAATATTDAKAAASFHPSADPEVLENFLHSATDHAKTSTATT